ncbi:MAG: HNH endonuclease [Yoonia sp.]
MWDKNPERFAKRYALKKGQLTFFRATAEHLKARSEGGENSRNNIVAACKFCNETRHKAKVPLSPPQYRAKIECRLAKGRWAPVRSAQILAVRKKFLAQAKD